MIPDAIKEQLRLYCDLVKKGKPAASIAIQERYELESLKLIDSFNLCSYVELLSDGWKTVWVYRYPHILEAIKKSPQVPKTSFDHWLLGKLYGYEEASIHEFLTKPF